MPRHFHELAVERADARIETCPLRAHFDDERADTRRERHFGVGEERGQRNLELAAPFWEHAPTFEQDRSQLVDERRTHAYQSRSHTVQRLQIELFIGLQLDKAEVAWT